MINGIRRMAVMSAKIMKQKKFPGVSVRALDKIINGEVLPVLSDIMPRDHQSIVDEVVKLMQLQVPGDLPGNSREETRLRCFRSRTDQGHEKR